MSENIYNKDNFKQLFQQYYTPLCNFANQIVKDRDAAEDVVQTVFIRMWNGIDTLKLKTSFKSYIFQSTRNASIDHLRKNNHRTESLDQVDIADEDQGISFDEEADQQLLRKKLMDAIDSLKPKTREIFKLHKFEGLTYPEIAEHLDIPQRTVEYNIYTAINQLKVLLADTVKAHLS